MNETEKTNQESEMEEENQNDEDFQIDFISSSAISKVSLKFLVFYVIIFWTSGLVIAAYTYEYFKNLPPFQTDWIMWLPTLILLPWFLFSSIFIFLFSCIFVSKLLIVLINLIHEPKEGVFRAEEGDKDFEFWRLRIEIKKIAMWLARNCPIPYIDALAYRWFGVNMDFSSHLNDAWCDMEFISFGRKTMVGQAAVIMSSMVIGKYLIIKKVIIDDYCVVGGQSTISPGTYYGHDVVTGALSYTNHNQTLEDGWIYFGMPVIKLKENKYAETARDKIRKVVVDDGKKYYVEQDVNIDEDKKHLVKKNGEEK